MANHSPDYTPGTSTPYLTFTPKRAMASFENLVALANHQERLKEARKMVWRDRGEPVVQLRDLWQCLEHAGRGGIRAGTMAFSIRACVNIVLALIRTGKMPNKLRLSMIRHAIFGLDTFRFAGMLGSFVSIYKFLINALPLLLPDPTTSASSYLPRYRPFISSSLPQDLDVSALDLSATAPSDPPETIIVPLAERRARLSLSAHAHEVLVRKKTRRWHAVFAGAVAGGLAVMLEARSRRGVIAQQLFVRGLQGSYNAYTTKRNIRVPHGDVIVFTLACGQIMYGFLLRPDILPRSYNAWIGHASKVSAEAVRMNKSLIREGNFDIGDLDTIIKRTDVTPNNLIDLLTLRNLATSPHPSFGRHCGPCSSIHPMVDSCAVLPFVRFMDVFKWMLPIYGALHVIPAVLFKRKLFWKEPWRMLLKAGWGSMRSSAFLGVFVIIYQTALCFKNYIHEVLTALPSSSPFKPSQRLVDLLISKYSFMPLGFMSGLSLFVEERRRRGELAMYVLPKGLESAWVMLRGRGLVFKTGNYGETLLTAIGMGMVMSCYQNDPQHLSGLVRRILYQFIGPN